MKLTESMMRMLRGRLNLKPDDTSRDNDILSMSPVEIVRECTAWQLGDPYWATMIASWIKITECNVDDLCM